MGRIREYIRVNGKKCWTLFDTGLRNTYVVPEVAALLARQKLPKTFKSSLGGGIKKTTHGALLNAEVQKHKVFTHIILKSSWSSNISSGGHKPCPGS